MTATRIRTRPPRAGWVDGTGAKLRSGPSRGRPPTPEAPPPGRSWISRPPPARRARAHARQPEAGVRIGGPDAQQVDAATVVVDTQQHVVVLILQRRDHVRGAAMLPHVG